MQHPVHVRLAVRTRNYIAPPQLIQCTSKTGTSFYQLRPTPATRIEHLAATLRLRPIPATRIEYLTAALRLRPTPATRFDHLAASLRLRSYQQPTSTIYLTTTTIHELTSLFVNSTNKLSYLLYYNFAFASFIVLLAVITRTLN